MRKQTSLKKGANKTSRTRGKKTAAAARKKTRSRTAKEKTVLTKLKEVLDGTAAKLKTLLPGDNRSNHRDQEGTEMA